MSEVKVNKISPRTNCGTVQLGDSGDTITIPAGATIVNNGTQTGFGRTGTVDWDTTAKTASFTAVSGNGYFVNTTSGAITVTLPAGSAGDIVGISDYASTFQTNNVTIAPNGSDNINGINENATLSTQGLAVSLVYVDSTRGWKSVTGSDNDTTGTPPAAFITATGGTVTCCGDYKVHTFTGPGTFCVSCAGNPLGSDTVDYLVIAGGGGGAYYYGGGGGAGGYRFSNGTASGCYSAGPAPLGASALPVTASPYPITVGGGGATSPTAPPYTDKSGSDGSNTIFSSITSTGGGGGGGRCTSSLPGRSGGSGGGAGGEGTGGTGGTGNTPPVSPPQGNNGSPDTNPGQGGGGGGAGGAGGSPNPSNPNQKTAGQGLSSSITFSAVFRGGGGNAGPPTGEPTADGRTAYSVAGAANTGSGAGADADTGNNGGSGIVIIRYKYQ